MEVEIGKVAHFFTNIGVAVIELTDKIVTGDTIHIKGATTDFTQKVESMQINHAPVKEAKEGQSIGLKVKERVREGDKVYKVIEEISITKKVEIAEEKQKPEAKPTKAKAKGKRGRPPKKKA